jgi:hypothetical protein
MKDLEKLQTVCERMLAGEKKRRETALAFVKEVEKILKPIAPQLWGDCGNYGSVVDFGQVNFQWDNQGDQPWGWRVDRSGEDYPAGTRIEFLHGIDFWFGIRRIIEVIPQIIAKIDEKEASREKLMALLK